VEWPRDPTEKPLIPVGEGAVRPGEDGKRRVRMKDPEESDEDEMMDDEEVFNTPAQSRTQRSQRASKSKTPMDVDEEDEEPEIPAMSSQPKRRSSRK
jgi:hypothetical protein